MSTEFTEAERKYLDKVDEKVTFKGVPIVWDRYCPKCGRLMLDLRNAGTNVHELRKEGRCFQFTDNLYECMRHVVEEQKT